MDVPSKQERRHHRQGCRNADASSDTCRAQHYALRHSSHPTDISMVRPTRIDPRYASHESFDLYRSKGQRFSSMEERKTPRTAYWHCNPQGVGLPPGSPEGRLSRRQTCRSQGPWHRGCQGADALCVVFVESTHGGLLRA